MRRILLSLVCFVFSLNAQAEDENRAEALHCEHYLTDTHRETAEEFVARHMLERPLNFYNYSYPQQTALEILGLKPPKDAREMRTWVVTISRQRYSGEVVHPIVLKLHRFQNGVFEEFLRYEFPDFNPFMWQNLEPEQAHLSHAEMLDRFSPFRRQTLEFRDNDSVGFAGDLRPDQNRVFLALRHDASAGLIQLEFGLDLPCARYGLYANHHDLDNDYREIVKTPGKRFCRIPVLAFEAPQVEE